MILKIFSITLFLFLYTLLFYLFFKIIKTMKVLNSNSYNPFTPFDNDKNINSFFSDVKYNHVTNPFRLKNNNIPLTLPLELINNGTVYYDNLNKIEKDFIWLKKVLFKKGFSDPNLIYKALLDSGGRVIILNEER